MANEREIDLRLEGRLADADRPGAILEPPEVCMNRGCTNRPAVGYGPRPAVDFAGGHLPERTSTLWLCNACNRPEVLLDLSAVQPAG